MGRPACIVLVALIVFGACGTGTPLSPTESAPDTSPTELQSTSSVLSTTTVPRTPGASMTTSSSSASSTVTTSPSAVPSILLADEQGIRVVGDSGRVFLVGQSVALAVPDLMGGVVYQLPQNEILDRAFDELLGRNAYVWAAGGPQPIWHLREPGGDPVAIVSHPDAILRLVDVVEIDGHAAVLYRMAVGGPPSTEAWLQMLEWLHLYDLATGTTTVLGLVGSWDSSRNEVRIGADLVAFDRDEFGDVEGTAVGMVPLSRLEEPVDQRWLPNLVLDDLTYGPRHECDAGSSCERWAVATAASDGSRLAWVFADVSDSPSTVNLVTVDAARGLETGRTPLGTVAPSSHRQVVIDDDGTWSVVSGVGPDRTVVLIGPGGVPLDLGHADATAQLWQSRLTTHTEFEPPVLPITLVGDGLGIVDFGTPTDDALEIVGAVLGPPSRSSVEFYRYHFWDQASLTLRFDTHPFYRDDGVEHLVGWSHWTGLATPLATRAGIGLGATFDDVMAGHGDQVTIPPVVDVCAPQWMVWIDDPGPEITRRILVAFDGPFDQGGVVGYMSAGASEGC